MNLTVFGATGATGKPLVEQALAQGDHVRALVRNPAKLGITHPNLTILQGDATDAAAVARAIEGADAVISVLAPTENSQARTITQATRNIIAGMVQYTVKRLVVSAGAGIADPNDAPDAMAKLMNGLVKLLARGVYEDMLGVTEVVRASDRDWTIVRAPMLSNGAKKGEVRVAWVGKGMGRSITRADLAEFMLKQASDRTYIHQAPAVSN